MSTTDCHRNVCQLLLDQGVFSEDDLLERFGEVCVYISAAESTVATFSSAFR